MKTKLTFIAFFASVVAAFAAPLPATTAVHAKPDATSPAITFLKAGTEPAVVPNSLASTPAGWLAVELPGPFEGYVANKDILKSLDVHPGAAVHLAPKPDSAVLATVAEGDKTEITGLHGRWTQIRLEKQLTGYIYLGTGTPESAPAPASSTAGPGEPVSPAPVAPIARGTTEAGKPAPVMNLGEAGGAMLPRLFQGTFVTTRSPFKPRRPYDWALNDGNGKRYAFLDISKLLLTEQIESYLGHVVVVYGAARTVPESKDVVIQVESLQLK